MILSSGAKYNQINFSKNHVSGNALKSGLRSYGGLHYNDRLNQLNSEILTKGENASPIEQYLLDKFNAEIGYCNLALFKAGIGIADEIRGLVEIGKKHIEKFENMQSTSQQFLAGFYK